MNGGITFYELGIVAGYLWLFGIIIGVLELIIEWIKDQR